MGNSSKAKAQFTGGTVFDLMNFGARQLAAAGVVFGHGSDNAFDEAAELVFFACGLRHEAAPAAYSQIVSAPHCAIALELLRRRIEERVPAAYLTRRMWFCGHEFYVDSRVLVPRSPFAELIGAQFRPWIDPRAIHTVLDIGTGSGCIAIATALELPQARVDAADISSDALAVANINIDRLQLQGRVTTRQSDVFSGLKGARYDLIVSNPPYVSQSEAMALPAEYQREPQLGLVAGDDGLSIVRRILREAEAHLNAQGVLIVEVGDTETTLIAAYPHAPFMWLEFERGGGGVFLLTAEQLKAHREDW